MTRFLSLVLIVALPVLADPRPRARDLGIAAGILAPGPWNAITDVGGVLVGHATVIRGDRVRTGVTAVLPHGGNLFREKVPGAIFVGNGFGKLMGSTQVDELGEIESPILLTNTLSVGRVADAAIDFMLALPGNENVRSINIVVGETNDGGLNDIRGRHVGRDEVFSAIRGARGEAVEEGSVGAGTGTIAFGFKGGIGTSSRRLPAKLGGYTVGVLVQTNFGGVLSIAGAPVGRELGRSPSEGDSSPSSRLGMTRDRGDGSIMIVIATDAPVDARNLRRMGARAIMGLARTGAAGTNGSGDYAIAFSTARNPAKLLPNDALSPLFLATIEATEEAIYNSLFKATTVESAIGRAEAIPIEETLQILRKSGALAEPADTPRDRPRSPPGR
ncbi:MAG TPA: P1 family peptidase [Thermoanaerobaculia bacterium]|nr:P1 family peptidase [Thermoanaerobaculia bacterium]